MMLSITRAAETLLHGGVIAYPTEGVYGLGCLPNNVDALTRLLAIKQRSATKGLILLAANPGQLDTWIDLPDDQQLPAPNAGQPITWIAPASERVSQLVKGVHASVAVRITTNTIAAAICDAVGSAITSTSANMTGEPAVRNAIMLRRKFSSLVDYIVPGDCGPADGPSEIRDLVTGLIIRHGKHDAN
jgi:L-threonylcarbamoyladenylate synthase